MIGKRLQGIGIDIADGLTLRLGGQGGAEGCESALGMRHSPHWVIVRHRFCDVLKRRDGLLKLGGA